MNEPYKILIEGAEAETELKKSRFIAHTAPAESEEAAREFINEMKKKYYDARHNCYAYIIGKDADTVKYSDDGEPSQTAGLPMYNILKESGVRNAVVVVTRYFGGTLLGTGPLSRMYADAVKLGLEASVIKTKRYGTGCTLVCDYPDGEKIRRYLEREGIETANVRYGGNVEIDIKTASERFEKVKADLVSLTLGRVSVKDIKSEYFVDNE